MLGQVGMGWDVMRWYGKEQDGIGWDNFRNYQVWTFSGKEFILALILNIQEASYKLWEPEVF